MDPNILYTGLASACLTSVILLLKDWLLVKSRDKKDSDYAALRLAIPLETFAIECAERIRKVWDYLEAMEQWEDYIDGRTQGSENEPKYPEASEEIMSLPELGPFTEHVAWKYVSPKLFSNAFSLPNEVALSNRVIRQWPHDYGEEDQSKAWECLEQCSIKGCKAWELACNLRKAHGLPPFDSKVKLSDVFDSLKKEYKEYLERQEWEANRHDHLGLISRGD